MINYILFDVDNTLYQGSWGFDKAINARMNHFVSQFLGVSLEEAQELRRNNSHRFGTTLEWLRKEKGLTDLEAFFEAVHPKEVHLYLKKEKDLPGMLASLPQQKAVLTNAPRSHAMRILEYLEIQNSFDSFFDLLFHDLKGKPHRQTYQRTLEEAGFQIEETLFIDDHPKYLYPFKEMGGQVLLVDELGRHLDKEDLPRIRTIFDLPQYLKENRC